MSDKVETYSVRAPDPTSKGKWISIGVGWKRDDGGMNIKLNSIPVGTAWDGAAVILPPLKEEEK